MRWRLVDRIDAFEPWSAIRGRKAVTFEEVHLPEPLGRRGVLPESLVLGAASEFLLWLVAASSGFERIAFIEGIDGAAFSGEVRMGDVVLFSLETRRRDDSGIEASFAATAAGRPIASGVLAARLAPLGECLDREDAEGRFREIHGAPA
ncbi:MAG: hypothetical protein AAB215_09900 [Planctomycetota bacterium]